MIYQFHVKSATASFLWDVKLDFQKSLYLSEGEDAFLSPDHAAFHHDKVIVHFAIVWEASLRGRDNREQEYKKVKGDRSRKYLLSVSSFTLCSAGVVIALKISSS